MNIKVGSYEAKTKLPELLRGVQEGNHYTITLRGEAVAELVPAHFGTSPDIYAPTLLYGKRHRWYPKTVRERRVVIHLELLDWVGCL